MLSMLCFRPGSSALYLQQQGIILMSALSHRNSTLPCLSSLEVVMGEHYRATQQEYLTDFLLIERRILDDLRQLAKRREMIKISLPVIRASWIAEIEPRVKSLTVRFHKYNVETYC